MFTLSGTLTGVLPNPSELSRVNTGRFKETSLMFRMFIAALKRPVVVTVAAAAFAVVGVASAPLAPSAFAQAGGFGDVSGDAYYAAAVSELATAGVFVGTECDGGEFCPNEPLDRATMAVWTVRVLDGKDPDPVAHTRFADVAVSHPHAAFIERFAQLRVTKGCGDGSRFCPDGPVTRAQVAVFLTRAFGLTGGPDPGFSDVPESAWYQREVAALVQSGVTEGCGDGSRFCPDQATTRAHMAAFLHRAMNASLATTGEEATLRIAYVAGGHLFVADADGTNKHQLTGDLRYDAFPSRVEWSPDGTRIAYDFANHPLSVADADGTNTHQIALRGSFYGWSPDSTRIAYADTGLYIDDPEATFVADADGTNKHEIPGSFFGWSPDSTRIAYVAPLSSDWRAGHDLFVADADGSNKHHIHGTSHRLDNSARGIEPNIAWSPNGAHIFYFLSSTEGRQFHSDGSHVSHRLFVVDADGGNKRTLLSHRGVNHVKRWVLSPDGNRVYYERWWMDKIFVVNADGSNNHEVVVTGDLAEWRLSPDGSRIAYSDYAGRLSRVVDLFVVEADGSNKHKIAAEAVNWGWSPNGAHIAYDDPGGIFVVDADGSNKSKIASGEGLGFLRWSPDGSRIVYQVQRLVDSAWTADLFIMDSDGSNKHKIAEDAHLWGWR